MAKRKTKEDILKAAEKLFSIGGYDGTATKMIASEAGITEMTLFNHFPTKELLYKTVVKERYLAIEIESVFSELTYDDLENDLMKISAKLIGNFVDNKNVLMMRLKEKQNFQNDESFTVEKDPLIKKISPVFTTYEEKGILNGTGEKAALHFMAAFKGLCHISLLEDRREEDIRIFINDYISIFCHGIMRK